MYEEAVVSIVTVLIVVPTILALVLLFLRYATEGPEHPLKRLRYEAGNPPRGAARVPTLYPYFGYILIFVALDPVFMLLFLLPTLSGNWRQAVLLSLTSVLILLPPIAYAVRYARRREYWSL